MKTTQINNLLNMYVFPEDIKHLIPISTQEMLRKKGLISYIKSNTKRVIYHVYDVEDFLNRQKIERRR